MVFPPGPQSFFGLQNIKDFSSDTLGFIERMHREYGDNVSFRMGPYRTFFFYHPDQVKEILVKYSKDLPKFERNLATLRQWDGNGLLLSDGEFWQRQHRLVQPAFAPRRFGAYAEIMAKRTSQRVESWKAKQLDGIDIDEEMTGLTLEIISEALFGAEVSTRAKELGQAVAVLSEISVAEMKQFLPPPRWLPTAYNRRKNAAIKMVDDLIWGFIKERRKNPTDRGDLLSMLMLATDEEGNKAKMTDQQVRDEAMVLFLAGHDTTASALIWTWYLLGRHPEIEEKAYREVKQEVGLRLPRYADSQRLPYLRQIIDESLRLYPPAIGIFARQAKKDLEIGGHKVPKGSLVYAFSYVTQRDARWFPDPLKFDPDRFSEERQKSIPTFAYFPFGGGPRGCIGMPFSLVEMTMVLSTILQKCRLRGLPGESAEPQAHLSLRPRDRLRFALEWRAS